MNALLLALNCTLKWQNSHIWIFRYMGMWISGCPGAKLNMCHLKNCALIQKGAGYGKWIDRSKLVLQPSKRCLIKICNNSEFRRASAQCLQCLSGCGLNWKSKIFRMQHFEGKAQVLSIRADLWQSGGKCSARRKACSSSWVQSPVAARQRV